MKFAKITGIMIAGAVLVILLAGCPSKTSDGGDSDTLTSPLDTPTIVISDSVQVDTAGINPREDSNTSKNDTLRPDPGAGRKASPDFTLEDMSGKSHVLSAYQGKVVLLDFWATTCGPCKQEIPHLVALYNKYKSQGFVAFGIGLDKKSNLERYLGANPIAYPVLVDERGSAATLYGVNAIPRTLLIDKKGRVAFDHIGYKPGMEAQIEQEITALLAE
ncbi:TlpA family protein disulfide reductase [candidate division WOR-3 bacterium]|nr:TlpA family protein disulfide reductase [candidate division WOR-3 bacterium]